MGDTVMTWDSVSGWPTVGDFFLRLDSVDLLTTELVKVTSVNVGANQTTVVRAQEGTSASGLFVINSTGGNDLTAQTLTDAMVRLDTAASQTLTGPLAIPTALGAAPAATSFGTVPVKFGETLLGAIAATVAFSSIPATFRHLSSDAYCRGDVVAINQEILLRINNDATANYDYQRGLTTAATTWTVSEVLASNALGIGFMPAASATAAYFGQVRFRIEHYAGTTGNKNVMSQAAWAESNATGAAGRHGVCGGKWRTTATATNRIDYLLSSNNYIAGSYFSVQLEP